jgi:integrase/recombinase XerD
MREAGLKPVTCNGNIRVVKTYLRWKELPFKLNYLKVEEKELQLFKPERVRGIIQFKPRTVNDKRVHVLVMTLLDTGLRLEDAIRISAEHIDFDSLLVSVEGQGNRERKVPISFEFRKVHWAYLKNKPRGFVFSTRHGARHSRTNALRDFKSLCKKVGVAPPPRALHSLRHFFAGIT